jgi:predicted nucleic acid-binding protein
VINSVFEEIALIDTSAVVALLNRSDEYHDDAKKFFSSADLELWATLDITGHECYTRARYKAGFQAAMEHYRFLRAHPIRLLRFHDADEEEAERILQRYSTHALSFHDALCAAVMKRFGIYRVFSFDSHFLVMGFQVLPGPTQ